MTKRPELIRRQEALAKTIAKYRGKPFEWGKTDCLTMVRSHLVAMGHRKLPKLPDYDDAIGAVRALKAAGFNDIEGLLDSLLPRIAWASMLAGDIALVPGEGPLDALHVSLGFKTMGFHEDHEGTVVMRPHQIKAAWRA